MKLIENYVYTQVRNALMSAYENVDISAEYVENPSVFPHVSFEMSDNITDASSMTADNREFASEQAFAVNIYTVSETKKSDAQAIAEVIDDVMMGLGFRRALWMRTPNIDRNIYRLTLRYSGLVADAADGTANHFKVIAR